MRLWIFILLLTTIASSAECALEISVTEVYGTVFEQNEYDLEIRNTISMENAPVIRDGEGRVVLKKGWYIISVLTKGALPLRKYIELDECSQIHPIVIRFSVQYAIESLYDMRNVQVVLSSGNFWDGISARLVSKFGDKNIEGWYPAKNQALFNRVPGGVYWLLLAASDGSLRTHELTLEGGKQGSVVLDDGTTVSWFWPQGPRRAQGE